MKILLTGGSGMVGKNIREFIPDVYAPLSNKMNLMSKYDIQREFIRYKPDLVIHCAGKVGGIQANVNNPYDFGYQNAQMGINLIDVCKDYCRLINLGSSCMYPKDAKNPLMEDSILSGQLEPTNESYALSKILIAKLCEYSGCDFKTIIPCNLYGKYDSFDSEHAHMLSSAIRKIADAKNRGENTVEIWGDGSVRREFMYVIDLVRFIKLVIDNYDKCPNIINCGIGIDYTIMEYYRAVAKVIGFDGCFLYNHSRPSGMKQKLVDITRQKKLGWEPIISLQYGIELTYQYWRTACCH